MARVFGFARNFTSDRRGNFAILTGLSVGMLAITAGFGVNAAQLFNAKSALQSALDAAVTSTARDLTTGTIAEADARSSIEAFLIANQAGPFARAGVVLQNVTVDRASKTVDAAARIDVPLAFPLFGSDPTREVGARTAAVYSDVKVEVAMMLDVTGSMARQKIVDLRNAATNAVDMLLAGQNPRDPRVRVAIVPYADAVNVGALADASVFKEREGGSDLPPYAGATQAYIVANTGSFRDDCATERKLANGAADPSDDGPRTERSYRQSGQERRYLARVNRDHRLSSSDCPTASVVPLTADGAALKRSIDAFRASGYTAGAIGVQWTRYMLSANWRRTITDAGLGAGPADADPKKVRKIAILMTDGEFNTAYAGGNARQGVNSQGNASRANAETICTAMKRDGIEVFTIGFDLNERNARAVMQNCASDDSGAVRHYFEASTGPELDAAFAEIIRNVDNLYLSM